MLAIIPARGGSKGLPRKNIKPLAGRPLIDYAIKAALAAERIDKVVVSTEDDEIAQVARACGAEIPVMRPMRLATDTAPNGLACLHMVDELARGGGVAHEEFALIQATSPFLTPEDIDAAVQLFERRRPAALVSVRALQTPIEAVFELDENGFLKSVLRHRYGVNFITTQRQGYGERYVVCGAITVVKVEAMRSDPNYYFANPEALGYVIGETSGLDIDTPVDFALAEFLMSRQPATGRGEDGT